MRITNLIELRAWAEENCPEEYARLPAAGSYEITAIGSCVCVYVGTIARTEIHHDLISFENDRLKVQAHLELGKAMPILVAGNFTRLTSSYYGKIELSQPFCWIWPGLEYSIGLDKFNALVRYVCMVRGFPGNLSDMPLGLQEVFPQLCADITRGQGTQSIESSWKGGKHGGKRLKEGGGGEMNGAKKDGVSTNNNVTDRQQNCRDVFENRIQYLCEEFHAYTSTLRADYEGFVEGQAQYGVVVKGLQKQVEVAECRVRTLEAELEEVKAGEKTWKTKFEKLQNIMRGAMDDLA